MLPSSIVNWFPELKLKNFGDIRSLTKEGLLGDCQFNDSLAVILKIKQTYMIANNQVEEGAPERSNRILVARLTS